MARPRAQIDLAALADAFAANGLHGTSSRALAEAVGLAKATLYVHGTSKEELLLRAVQGEVERVLDRLHAAERATIGRGARERATAAARALLDHAAARPAGARLLAQTARHAGSVVALAVDEELQRIPDRIEHGLRRDLAADGLEASGAAFLARALHGAASAVARVRDGEQRPARATLAAMCASMIPERPPPTGQDWPSA
ncbi:MAG TPA: helix-turn-helix domain-containing protein [Solirubrobacteraceae bacterium]|jgi:AcrR family transcriptional regulator|nr:helix-turn-helix domain-containing protein [Solirubrobacteraceae bacterium]